MRPTLLTLTLLSLLASCVGCADLKAMSKVGPSQEEFEQVSRGMSEAQVTKLLGKPSKRQVVQGGETNGERHLVLRWVNTNQIIVVTLNSEGVIGKQKT